MALRTSATTKFGDARAAARDIAVNVPIDRAPVDQTGATAIGAFGQIGGKLRQSILEDKLLRDFQQTGNIIQTLNDDRTVVTKRFDGSTDIDISQSDPFGDIDKASDAFKSITLGLDQGKISQERAAIEAEVILRKSIARAPAFADDFRRRAQEILGFNASGATMEAIFLSGPGPGGSALTQADRDNIEANQLVKTGHFATFEEALKAVVGARAFLLKEAANKEKIMFGEAAVSKIVADVGRSAQGRLNSTMLDAFAQIRRNGGLLEDLDSITSRFNGIQEDVIAEYTQIMLNSSASYQPEHYSEMRKEVARTVTANLGIIQNQDILQVLTKRQDILRKLNEIDAYRLSEDIMLMSVYGSKMVDDYLEFMAQANGDPQTRANLMRENKVFQFIGETLDARKIAPTFAAIRDKLLRPAIDSPSSPVDEETAKEVLKWNSLRHIVGANDPLSIDADIKGLAELDLPEMMLSLVGNVGYSYSNTTPDNRASVVQEWKKADNSVRQPLGRKLTNSQFLIGWDSEEGEFNIQHRNIELTEKVSFGTLGTQLAGAGTMSPAALAQFERARTPITVDVKRELEILNDVLLPAMRDVNWRNEFGEPDPEAWADQLIQEVNSFALDEERRAGLLGETGPPGSLVNMTISQQVALNAAMSTGQSDSVFQVLEDMGLTKFNQTTEGQIGLPLERLEEGTAFINTETKEVFVFEKGKLVLAPKELIPEITDKEQVFNTPTKLHERATPEKQALVLVAAERYAIPANLALAMVQQESLFDSNALSGKDARGLLQVTDIAAEDVLGKSNFNDEDNLDTGFRFMAKLKQRFGTWELALAAYNGGPTRLDKVNRDISRMPKETREYVKAIMGNTGAE